jgi:hypothetical protein
LRGDRFDPACGDQERALHMHGVMPRPFQHRDELAAYDTQLSAYLASPQGLFELWHAARLCTQADAGPPAET